MKLKKLKLKNIRSYEEQEINFPAGSLLLSGDVGAGKSSLLMAIEYALFGLQPGQRGTAILRNKDEVGEVVLECEIDGKEVIIERKLRRSPKQITNEYAAITIEGEKIECSVTELKTKLISLLGYPIEFIKKNNILYRYTVYTPQEQMRQIILEDPETRLNVLSHVFGIDKYKRIRENTTMLLTFLKEESKIFQGEIKTLDNDKEQLVLTKSIREKLKSKISEQQNFLLIFKQELIKAENSAKETEEKIREREKLEKEVEKSNILLSAKKENLTAIIKELKLLEKAISEAKPFNEELFNRLLQSINEQNASHELLNNKLTRAQANLQAISQAEKEQLLKKERIFKISICPTCLQDVSESHKHNILHETEQAITENKKKKQALENEIKETENSLKELKENKVLLGKEQLSLEIQRSNQAHLEQAKEKQKQFSKDQAQIEKDLKILEKHTISLKESILGYYPFEKLLRQKQEELKQALNNERQAEILLAQLTREEEIRQKEIGFFENLIHNKEKTKEKLQHIISLADWISNNFQSLINSIERNIFIQLRREFSENCNKWFHMLASESLDMHLDETFSPIIVQGGIEMDYAFLSGGERTAIALAYRLALHQVINTILSKIKTRGLLMLDEPTDGFSETQIDKMRDIFQELNAEQLIIVSHESKIEGFVENIINIRKENNSSKIKVVDKDKPQNLNTPNITLSN